MAGKMPTPQAIYGQRPGCPPPILLGVGRLARQVFATGRRDARTTSNLHPALSE